MSLANPLVYVRGTPIHIHLRFSSGAAVDPSHLRIALVNTTQITNETGSRSQKRAGSPSTPAIRTCIASAVCYRRPQDEDLGVVHAEIKVPKDLAPEFDFKGIHSEVSHDPFPPVILRLTSSFLTVSSPPIPILRTLLFVDTRSDPQLLDAQLSRSLREDRYRSHLHPRKPHHTSLIPPAAPRITRRESSFTVVRFSSWFSGGPYPRSRER
jgi:hypothetical protein